MAIPLEYTIYISCYKHSLISYISNHVLEDWLKQREGMAMSATRSLMKLKKKFGKGDMDKDGVKKEHVNTAEEHLAYIEGMLGMGGSWIMLVYDKGALLCCILHGILTTQQHDYNIYSTH